MLRFCLGRRNDVPELLGRADLFAFSTTVAEARYRPCGGDGRWLAGDGIRCAGLPSCWLMALPEC